MDTPVVLRSRQDASVNYVFEGNFPGLIEARYVRRSDQYFIVYLSSQTGCGLGCRMCHLTQSKQTQGVDVGVDGYLRQAKQVFAHYVEQESPAKVVHFNFMARGEALANAEVLAHADKLIDRLGELAVSHGVVPTYKFSTIMPRSLGELELTEIFRRSQPDIYYSLYSVDPRFRRRWLPRALAVEPALAKLVRWQQITHKLPVLHWAYIAGENDSVESTERLIEAVQSSGLRANINIVRYNPYSPDQGEEPVEDVIARNQALLQTAFPTSRVQVVTRVGLDVAASCGMFVSSPT